VLVRRPFHIYDTSGFQEELTYSGRFPYLYETDGRALRVRGRRKVPLSEVIVDGEDVITYVRYGDAVATVRGYIPGALAYEWRRLHANDLLWADVPENEYKDIQQAKRISLKFPIHSSIVNEVQEAGRRSRAEVLRFIFHTRGRAERFFRFVFCSCEAECSCPVRVEGKAEAAGYSFVAESGTKVDKVQSFLVDVAAYFVVNDGIVERRPKSPNVLPIVPMKVQKEKWRKCAKLSPYEKTKKAVKRDGKKVYVEDPDYDYDRGEFFSSSLRKFRENKEVKA